MVDSAPAAQENAAPEFDPQALLIEQQNEHIQNMRDSGDEAAARSAEIIRDIEDKTIYQDVDTGARVTILDGDSQSIMPYLEASHQQMLESLGGVDNAIDSISEQMQARVASGEMTQAAMDRQIEILREAGDDSLKFAQLRFQNNDFFAEQARISGSDPAAVNDVILITNKPVIMVTADMDDPSKPTEAVPDSAGLTLENLNMDSLIKIADGGELTQVGMVFISSEAYGIDTSIVDIIKNNFETLLAKEGSLDAMISRIEENIGELAGDETIPQESKDIIINAVRNSGGDSSVFAASVLNGINELALAGQEQERQHQERQAFNLQNLLGSAGEGAELSSLFSADGPVFQFFVGLIAAFTGQDPQEMMAKIQEGLNKGQSENKNENKASTPKDGTSAKSQTPDSNAKGSDPKADTAPKSEDSSPKTETPTEVVQEDVNQDAASPQEEDKGYVQGVGGRAVTFSVATLAVGEPVADFDTGSIIFGNGSPAPSIFNNLANPNAGQVSMVDPMIDMSATADTVEPPRSENVIGSLNAI